MPNCRCRKCDHRKTLTSYQFSRRPPKCACGSTEWRQDKYRERVEKRRRACRCHEYSFPHRRASGYCIHNPKVTAEDMRLREEQGSWA